MLPVLGLNDPDGQGEHVSIPELGLNVPVGHSVHDETDGSKNFPGGQSEHELELEEGAIPAGHS